MAPDGEVTWPTRELPSFAIPRPRLAARLDDGVQGCLTLVLGPSGSGKSVLLRQWATNQPDDQLAWLVADVTATDAVRLGHQLVDCIAHHHPGFGAEALRHLEIGGGRMGTTFLEALRRELAGLPPTVLVLEDLHELPVAVVEELDWLIRRAPASLRVLVASRTRPALSLARLRAEGQLTEVRAEELACTQEEVAAIVERVARVRLTRAQLERLHARTEGWVVGVHLAALALGGGGDVDAELARFGGAARDVADYLADEVVAQLPAGLQSFLRQTSVLDRMDAELCEAVTGRADSQQVLAELERRNLFVVALDGRRGWYRYHQLFAEMLRYQLQAEEPGQRDELLARAARWYLDRDELEPGVEHLLRAQRWTQALDIIGAHGWTVFERGMAATAIRWLEAVPAAERYRHPQAAQTLISLHRLVGNTAAVNRLLRDLEQRAEPGSRLAMAVDVLTASGVLWDRDPGEAFARAQAALAWLDDPPPDGAPTRGSPPDAWVRAVVKLAGGRALMLLDRRDEARVWLTTNLAGAGGQMPWRIRTLATLGRLDVEIGQLADARERAELALRLAVEAGAIDPTAWSEAQLVLGQVAHERDELDEAERALADAEVNARINRCTVLVALAIEGRARLAVARQRPREALELVDQWRRDSEVVPPVSVVGRLAAIEVRALVATGELSRAKRALARAPRDEATLAAAAELAADQADWPLLETVLGRWPSAPGTRARIQHLVWGALLAHQQAAGPLVRDRLLAAAVLAEADGHRRAFLETGRRALDLVRAEAEALGGSPARGAAVLVALRPRPSGLAETVTVSGREREVLGLLQTRLTNQEIADALNVSLNTLKTHLKRIYRKLDVVNRRQAVDRAEALGLLGADPHAGPTGRWSATW